MRPFLVLLCACVALGGCSLGDCSFETSRTTTNGGLIVADGAGAGDTLTVAFITDADPFIQLTVGAGVGINPPPTPDGAIEVLYDAVSVGISGDRLPRPLAATPRNDTLFVYADGSLDASIFSLTCSPPQAGISVDVRAILVPEGTVAARVTSLSINDVSPSTAAALRATDEARRLARPIHI